MNTKKTIGIVVVIVAIAAVALIVLKKPAVAPENGTLPPPSETAGGTAVKSYTLAEVAQHPNAASCWTTINGNVYDLTAWVGQHPGGEGAILSICGKDGTSAFMGQHGDNGRANSTLATFMIGTLAK